METLYKCLKYIALRITIRLFDIRFTGQAGISKRRIHQHNVEATPANVDECKTGRRVIGK
ncbi:MAG: hypothetical protein O3C40_17045 [Planctomycetota bacterium]|nr:hypothetical protein [Planctomycetota bacterium]